MLDKNKVIGCIRSIKFQTLLEYSISQYTIVVLNHRNKKYALKLIKGTCYFIVQVIE